MSLTAQGFNSLIVCRNFRSGVGQCQARGRDREMNVKFSSIQPFPRAEQAGGSACVDIKATFHQLS